MCSKKDYQKAARIASGAWRTCCYASIVTAFVDFFSGDNPRFDKEKFRRACASKDDAEMLEKENY